MVQVGFLGALALIASFLFETPHLPGSGTEWLVVLALALVCSGFGFTLQPVAQSGTTADHAALFCALNPFVAAALGAVCFHEHFGIAGLLGGAGVAGVGLALAALGLLSTKMGGRMVMFGAPIVAVGLTLPLFWMLQRLLRRLRLR